MEFSGSFGSRAVRDSRSVPSLPRPGRGEEGPPGMGYTPLPVEGSGGAGHKPEEDREEFPKVRFSCQTTLGGPDGVNSNQKHVH